MITLDDSITVPGIHALRLDGRLDESVLSPVIHQLVLGLARLRNVVSSLRQEGVQVRFDEARNLMETNRAETPSQHQVLTIAHEYRRIQETKRSRLPRLSLDYICQLHQRMFARIEEYGSFNPGQLKSEPNGMVDRSTGQWVFEATPPERTAAELGALLDWLQRHANDWPPVAIASAFFAEFQAIHPFHDGNGRLGRLLNLQVLKQLGYVNAPLVAIDGRFYRSGDRYYEKLRSTNDGRTWHVWARYYAKTLEQSYDDAVAMADFRPILDAQPGQTARELLAWVLSGAGGWFQRGDYPNPSGHSQSGISAALAGLAKSGVLEATGEKKARRYRLATKYLEKAFAGLLIDQPTGDNTK